MVFHWLQESVLVLFLSCSVACFRQSDGCRAGGSYSVSACSALVRLPIGYSDEAEITKHQQRGSEEEEEEEEGL